MSLCSVAGTHGYMHTYGGVPFQHARILKKIKIKFTLMQNLSTLILLNVSYLVKQFMDDTIFLRPS